MPMKSEIMAYGKANDMTYDVVVTTGLSREREDYDGKIRYEEHE